MSCSYNILSSLIFNQPKFLCFEMCLCPMPDSISLLQKQMQRYLEWRQVVLSDNQQKPSNRWGHGCVMIGHQMVLLGGFDSSYMNDLWVFDTNTMQWRLEPTGGDEQLKRSNFSMCYDSINNRVVVYGGKIVGKKSCNAVWVLEWSTKEWRKIGQSTCLRDADPDGVAPYERKYHVAQIQFPYLVVHGGEGVIDMDDLWVFNFNTSSWKEIEQEGVKPRARRFHASVLLDTTMIITGGCHSKYQPLNDAWRIDLSGVFKGQNKARWQSIKLDGNYKARWGHSLSYYKQHLYIFGGKLSEETNHVYSINTKTYLVRQLKVKGEVSHRRRHSAVFCGNSLIVFGGYHQVYFDDLLSLTVFENKVRTETPSLKSTMEQLVNSGNYDYQAMNTSDGLRLYVHPSIIRRKMGADTQAFLAYLMTVTLGKATKLLTKVYTSADLSLTLDNLDTVQPKNTTQQKYIQSLFKAYGVNPHTDILSAHPQICLIEKNCASLYQNYPAYATPSDQLNVGGVCTVNMTIAKARCRYFQLLLSSEFKEVDTHQNKCFTPFALKVIMKYLQTDLIIVPAHFQLSQWFELMRAAQYYQLSTLQKISEDYLVKQMDEYTLGQIYELAIKYSMTHFAVICSQLEVLFQASLQQSQKEVKPKPRTPKFVSEKRLALNAVTRSEMRFLVKQSLLKNTKQNPQK